jgi:hypothetical protein
MAKFIFVHEDGASWDAGGDVPKTVYATKKAAEDVATGLVGDNVKRAYLVAKVMSRVAAVVSVSSVDEVAT